MRKFKLWQIIVIAVAILAVLAALGFKFGWFSADHSEEPSASVTETVENPQEAEPTESTETSSKEESDYSYWQLVAMVAVILAIIAAIVLAILAFKIGWAIVWRWVLPILAVFLTALLILGFCLNWWLPVKKAAEESTIVQGYKFYNSELQGGDAADDYNFGYDRYAAAKGDPEWLKEDFKKSIQPGPDGDPALCAAVMAYADAKFETQFMGEFYATAKNDWSKAMNDAKDQFIQNPKRWKTLSEAFVKFIDSCDLSIGELAKATDQMYMNPYTEDGEPDVIVMETNQATGHVLTFTANIKGTKISINYRTECGYQPTNVAKLMKITPTPKPVTPKPTTPKEKKEPTPTPKQPDPEPDTPSSGCTNPEQMPKYPGSGPLNNDSKKETTSSAPETIKKDDTSSKKQPDPKNGQEITVKTDDGETVKAKEIVPETEETLPPDSGIPAYVGGGGIVEGDDDAP